MMNIPVCFRQNCWVSIYATVSGVICVVSLLGEPIKVSVVSFAGLHIFDR